MRLEFLTESRFWVKFNANSPKFLNLAGKELVPLFSPHRKIFNLFFNLHIWRNRFLITSGYFVLDSEGRFKPETIHTPFFQLFCLKERSVCAENFLNANKERKLTISYDTERKVTFRFEKPGASFVVKGSVEVLMGSESDGIITEHSEGLEFVLNGGPFLFDPAEMVRFKEIWMSKAVPCISVSIEKIQTVEIKLQLQTELFNRTIQFYFPYYSFKLQSLKPVQMDLPLFYTMKKCGFLALFFFTLSLCSWTSKTSKLLLWLLLSLTTQTLSFFCPLK